MTKKRVEDFCVQIEVSISKHCAHSVRCMGSGTLSPVIKSEVLHMQQHCNMCYGSPVGFNERRLRVKGELCKTSHWVGVTRKKSDVRKAHSIYGVRWHLYADLIFHQVYIALPPGTLQVWRKPVVSQVELVGDRQLEISLRWLQFLFFLAAFPFFPFIIEFFQSAWCPFGCGKVLYDA